MTTAESVYLACHVHVHLVDVFVTYLFTCEHVLDIVYCMYRVAALLSIIASEKGHRAVVELLLQYHADVNICMKVYMYNEIGCRRCEFASSSSVRYIQSPL